MNKIKEFVCNNKNLALNIIGVFGIKGLSLLVTLFTLPAYIRFFENQTILGIWYTVVSILNWVMFFDLGLGNGLRNLLPEALEKKDKALIRESISTTYISMTALVVLLTIIGSFLIGRLNWNRILNVDAELVENEVLCKCVVIVYIGILFQFVLKLVASVLYALQQSAFVNAATLASSATILLALKVIPSGSIEQNLVRMAYINTASINLPYIVISIFVYGKILDGAFPSIKYFNKKLLTVVLNVGIALLWLQLVFMVISSTNEFLISNLTSPENVVEYQAYFKIFNTAATVFTLLLTPIWSAVTKAQVGNNYDWIRKIYKVFLAAVVLCFVGELLIVPLSQWLVDLWLGSSAIIVKKEYAMIFAISSTLFVLHNVNTSIENGMSRFETQKLWMTIAAILDIPIAYLFVRITGSWIGIVIANILVLIPYEVAAPVTTLKFLNDKIKKIGEK